MDVQATPSGAGILLTWAPGDERDLAGYRVARSDRADGAFTPLHEDLHTTNAFFDGGSNPGVYYSVSAVDDLGNSSKPYIVGAP